MRTIRQLLPFAFLITLVGCSGGNAVKNEVKVEQSKQATTVNESNTNSASTDTYVSPLPDTAPTYAVAMTGKTPPFSIEDDYGVMQGLDVDVIRAIGEVQGFKVSFVKAVSWSDMFRLAESEETALAMSGISYRDKRAEMYSLSNTYIFNPAAVVYTDPSLQVKSLGNLTGKSIGAIVDSTSLEFANQVSGAKIVDQKTPFLAYSALLRGDIDATIYDYPVWQHLAKQIPEHKVIIQPIESEDEVNNKGAFAVIMASKGNAELIAQVNQGLETIKNNGKLDEIKQKWL